MIGSTFFKKYCSFFISPADSFNVIAQIGKDALNNATMPARFLHLLTKYF